MILVTAYPLGYALVLSLYNYRLTDPAGRSVRRAAATTSAVLTDPVWWNDFVTTVAHHRRHAWRSSWCSASASPW